MRICGNSWINADIDVVYFEKKFLSRKLQIFGLDSILCNLKPELYKVSKTKTPKFAFLTIVLAAKFLHIILALLVLLSTTGFTLSEHFCQSELQAVSVFPKAEGCQSEKAPCRSTKKSCSSHDEGDCNGCCNNSSKYFQSDQDKQTHSFEFKQLKNPVLLATIFVVFNIQLPSFETAKVNFLTYKPPIVCDDIQVLLQTFLC